MYYVFEKTSKNQFGPFSPDELKRKWEIGEFGEHTLVWWEGLQDWLPMEQALSNQQGTRGITLHEQNAKGQSMPPIRQLGIKEEPKLKQRWIMVGIFLCGSMLLIYLYVTI